MFVGILQISFEIPDSLSIKNKRSVISSLKKRLRNTFNVSVAETDRLNNISIGFLVIACVASDKNYAYGIISNVVNFLEKEKRIVLMNIQTEVFP